MSLFSDDDTVELPVPGPSPDVPPPGGFSAQVQVDFGASSHRGNVRPLNEDRYLVVRFGRTLQTLMTNLPEGHVPNRCDELGYGMVVADGIGGEAAGEVASTMAISTLVSLVLTTPDWMMRIGPQEAEEIMQRMADRYRQVDAVLSAEGRNDPSLFGMGTTMTLAASLGPDLILAHLGDSRAYLLRNGQLHQLTRDHTVAQSLADTGVIRHEEVATHRLRHVLTRALGNSEGQVDAEVVRITLADEDQVLLCTDGLTEMVDDATICTVLRTLRSADDACRALIDLALEHGGKDNVTVVLARYRFPHRTSATESQENKP